MKTLTALLILCAGLTARAVTVIPVAFTGDEAPDCNGALFPTNSAFASSVFSLGADGTERDLAVLEDGDNFGEVAVLEDAPRNATVTAESPTMFLTLRRAAFQKLLDRNPTIRAAIREQTERRRGAAVARKS